MIHYYIHDTGDGEHTVKFSKDLKLIEYLNEQQDEYNSEIGSFTADNFELVLQTKEQELIKILSWGSKKELMKFKELFFKNTEMITSITKEPNIILVNGIKCRCYIEYDNLIELIK